MVQKFKIVQKKLKGIGKILCSLVPQSGDRNNQCVLLGGQCDRLVDDVLYDNQLSCVCNYPKRLRIGLVLHNRGANLASF